MTRRSALMDRRALFATGAAAALLAASGVSAGGAPRRGGRLRLALSGAQRSDGWAVGAGLFMQVARQGLIHECLTEVAADGTLRPELATDWKSTTGGRVWAFTLRQGVRFHDGVPFTARDAVASLAAALPPDADVTADGDFGLRIGLGAPNPSLPLLLSLPDYVIRPAHAPDAGIGTGLYRMRRFSAGQQVLAERVSAHFKDGTAGWFDEVELVSIPSEPVRAQALGAYMVDAIDVQDARLLAGLPDVILLPGGRIATQAVSRDLSQPAQIGVQYPMDNLRAAERWWFT